MSLTIQLFEHPPFFHEKWLIIVFQAHSNTHVWNYISISKHLHLVELERGCQTSASLRQSLWSYSELPNVFQHITGVPCLKLYSNIQTPTPCGAWMGVAKRLLAFDSHCGATARVTECLPAHYRRFQMSTRLLQSFQISTGRLLSLQSSNRGCVKCVLAFGSLCRARTGVANVY